MWTIFEKIDMQKIGTDSNKILRHVYKIGIFRYFAPKLANFASNTKKYTQK